MIRRPKFFLLAFLPLLILGCQNLPSKHWSKAVPQKSTALIVPDEQTTLSSVMDTEYIPFLDDITSSAIQLVSNVDSYPDITMNLHALVLYPGTSDRLQPIWMVEAPNAFIENLKLAYHKEFTQNTYLFRGQPIQILHMQNRVLYAAQLHNLLLLSESSLGIEDAIRSYLGITPPIEVAADSIRPSTLILNIPALDRWMEQVSKVGYRPRLIDPFKGLGPATLNVRQISEENTSRWVIDGTIPLTGETKTDLAVTFSSENAPVILDRYISSNAAFFAILRQRPRMAPPTSVEDPSPLDSLLMKSPATYTGLSGSMDSQFAIVTYAQSGFLSTGEHLYIRSLADRSAFSDRIASLEDGGYINRRGNSYLVRSRVLSRLIGAEFTEYTDYYLDIAGDAVIISRRKGLAELVESDRNRRRVIYYEPDYRDIRNNLPDSVSGFAVANTEFYDFIEPFLATDHNIDAITTKFDLLSATVILDEKRQRLDFSMQTYKEEESTQPYRERWVYSTGNAALTGPPVMGDIRGSTRDEVVFSTETGSVIALATDGTSVTRTSTDGETPIGSPVIYDWYGTNQNVILLAAGNKIYGWNDDGTLLPRFPFQLDEQLTSPLTISDVNRDGLPEIVVATADRRIHVLNGRGNNISGWPVTTNTPVRNKIRVDYMRGTLSVIAFSENAVHAWNNAGNAVGDFPAFVNASLVGSPVLYENNVLGNAADGNLYSVGRSRLLPDSMNVFSNLEDSLRYEALYISNSPLSGSPSVNEVTVQSDSVNRRSTAILTMSSRGSVFLVDPNGQLLLTRSMGQPVARDFSPFISDLNGDGVQEIVALASFGRLYAWEVSSGERIYSLPTSGIKHPAVTDLDGDGNVELIAQTNEGVRCWTIFGE